MFVSLQGLNAPILVAVSNVVFVTSCPPEGMTFAGTGATYVQLACGARLTVDEPSEAVLAKIKAAQGGKAA
jgi:hypothetical protein